MKLYLNNRKIRRVISLAIFLTSLFIAAQFSKMYVRAEAPDIIDRCFEMMGTTEDEFLGWSWNKITNCMKLLDNGMKDAGVETHFEDIFENATNEGLTLFEDVENEEEAYEVLKRMFE